MSSVPDAHRGPRSQARRDASLDAMSDAMSYDTAGAKVGRVVQLFAPDPDTKPVWATVATGLLGSREACVPLRGAQVDDDGIHLACTRAQIAAAPPLSRAHELTAEDEDRLRAHYGLDTDTPDVPADAN